jgi:4-amino-4-deoxy-L-arabinose transferase-like glycosyltransferase
MLMGTEQLREPKVAGSARLIHIMLLGCIMVGGTLVRVHALAKPSYWYDEICSVLYARGQTEAIFDAPKGYFEHPPALASEPGMRSWKDVWCGFDTTPPLYPSLLRLWWHAFGDGDISGRMLSVTISVLTILALFDAARLILGPNLALWVSALCAASPPMVRCAQEARAYALLGLLGVLACDIALRIVRFGGSQRRYILLWLLCAAALLTHYFVAGGIAGIALFAIIELRGGARVKMLCTVAASLVVLLWTVPLLWIHGPSVHQGIDWLAEPRAGLLWATVLRVSSLPLEYLIRPLQQMSMVCMPAVMLLVLPLFLRHLRPGLLLVGLWPMGIIGLVAVSDLWLSHGALEYDRYTLAAAPMVFVSLVATADLMADWIPRTFPGLGWLRGWLRHAVPGVVLLGALLAVPNAYDDQQLIKPKARELARDIQQHVKPGDVLVIESRPLMGLYTAGVTYLSMDFYDGPFPFAIAILESPADDAMRRQLWSHKQVWVVKCFPAPSGNDQVEINGYIGSCKLTPAGSMQMFAGRLYHAQAME